MAFDVISFYTLFSLMNCLASLRMQLTSEIDKSCIPSRCFCEILTALFDLIAIKTNSITINL